MLIKPDVVVICTNCGQAADYTPPNGADIYGTWDWHKPCRHCGAEAWASHETSREWRSGRLIVEDREG